MTDIWLYTKLAGLPLNLKSEVSDFIDFLIQKRGKESGKIKKRVPGKAKGLIKMRSNFDDPIEGFKDRRTCQHQILILSPFLII
jgi:hypothetical protein